MSNSEVCKLTGNKNQQNILTLMLKIKHIIDNNLVEFEDDNGLIENLRMFAKDGQWDSCTIHFLDILKDLDCGITKTEVSSFIYEIDQDRMTNALPIYGTEVIPSNQKGRTECNDFYIKTQMWIVKWNFPLFVFDDNENISLSDQLEIYSFRWGVGDEYNPIYYGEKSKIEEILKHYLTERNVTKLNKDTKNRLIKCKIVSNPNGSGYMVTYPNNKDKKIKFYGNNINHKS